jgi:transcriptional regulator with XRE-family HTH domain
MRQTNNVQKINVHVPLLFGQKFNFFGEDELLLFTDAIKRQNPLFVGSLTDPGTHPKCVTIFVAAVQGRIVPDIRFPEEIECLPTAGFMEREDFPISFGEWIKQCRKALDLTQDGLAQRAGCSIFALRKIESGERRPSRQLAELLAGALEIPTAGKATFIRVARGQLALDRLHATSPEAAPTAAAGMKATPHHLPLSTTPLLGRETEVAAMTRLFADPRCRLLTLTGMGGIGKTRLALEFGACQCGLFPGGVYFIPLAGLHAPELIIPAVAEAIGFTFSGPVAPKEQLIRHLTGAIQQPALLILDNLEHLIAPSATAVELASELLQRLPP